MNSIRTKLSLLALALALLVTSACTKTDVKKSISDTAIKTNPVSEVYRNLMCLPGSQACIKNP